MDDLTPSLPELAAAPAGLPGDLPADESDPVRRRRRGPLVALGALAAVVIVGVPAGIAVYARLAAGAPDVVDRMVPADADVYATVYLDPSLSQKLNLQGLLGHLPGLASTSQLQSRVDEGMDTVLKPEGLSFAKDVRPWLGTQVALAMRLTDGTPTAVMIASTDDRSAEATLARIRTTDGGRTDAWSTQQHGAVTVSVGTPAAGGGGTSLAYAYLDHTAVVGNSAAMIEEVIDTDQGRHAPLRTAPAYVSTLQRLPADRLGVVYASGPAITSAIGQGLSGSGLGDPSVLKLFDQSAGALKSVGLAVSAQPKGFAADLAVVTDTSKLTPAERTALQSATASTTANPAVGWIPTDAAGFLTIGGLDTQGVVDGATQGAAGSGLDLGGALKSLGITGSNGLLAHLTGDLALEVRTGQTSAIPGGALLAGDTDDPGMTAFLTGLAHGFSALAPLHTAQYRGATITSLTIPGIGDTGIVPAFTVLDGMTVVGTSPAQVEAVVDAHLSGSAVTAQPAFAAAGAYSAADPILYLDLDRIRAAVEKALPADLTPQYDRDVKPDLEHLHGLRITSQGTGNNVTGRLFLDVG